MREIWHKNRQCPSFSLRAHLLGYRIVSNINIHICNQVEKNDGIIVHTL